MISRRTFLKIAAAWLNSQILAGTFPRRVAGKTISDERRPNLLFVFSDQQSWDMLGCYGNESIRTPCIDEFAKDAVLFRHCISSNPVCSPYRGMLFSGLHSLYNGVLFNDYQMLPGSGNYFAEVLGTAGYRLGYVGKWHLYGGDRNRPIPPGKYRYGFNGYFLSNNCTVDFRAGKSWYWDEQGKRQIYPKWESDSQTDQAIEFLEQSDGDNRNWALFVSWHPPHNMYTGIPDNWMYGAPEEDLHKYDPATIHLRPNSPDTLKQREMYRDYYASCSNLDTNFGRLLEKLKALGQLDNTIIVYTSDHGDCLRSVGRYEFHKRRPEADSSRVPLIIRYPRLLKPRTSELLVGTLDLMPTLLGLMDISPPDTCQGRNLSKVIAGENDNAVDSVPLFSFDQNWRGIYTRRYTYSFGKDRKRFNRLYDRIKDPWETRNLFDDGQYVMVKKQLHQKTLKWLDRFNDRFVPFSKLRAVVLQDPAQQNGPVKGRPVDLLQGVSGMIDKP